MMNKKEKWSEEELNRLHKRFVARVFIVVPLLMVVIFLLAGRIDYWQGWGFGITFLAEKLVEVSNKELVVERAHPGPGIPWWDKVFMAIDSLAFAIIVIGPLDTGRFYWSPPMPWYAYLIGYVLFISSIVLALWAMRTNRFFSSFVRIQDDRGHQVIQTGPYRIVRHPGYLSVLLNYPGMVLVFGSLWCIIPAVVLMVAIVVRTYLEDNFLQEELQGYAEYTKKVRKRLIPYVW